LTTLTFPRKALAAALVALALPATHALAQELRIGMRAGPEAMDPHYMALGTQIAQIKNMYEALVWQDERLQVQPGLATSWRVIDDFTWEFKLRPNVKFHNGANLTARDVKFSLERVPGAAGPDGGLVINTRNINRVDVVDDLTLRIGTAISNPSLPQDLTRIMIVPASIGGAKVPDFNSGKAAIGTGPFKLSSFKPRQELVVERFDGYWRGPAPWSKVTFTEISNDSARVAALQSKRVDLINYVPFTDVAQLKRSKDVSLTTGDSIYIFILYPDTREKTDLVTDKSGKPLPQNPFRDVRVREALSLAIDRKAVADKVLEGAAKPAHQLISDGFFGSLPKPAPLEFNPEKAKRLLAEAGYPNGFSVPIHCSSDRLPGDGATCAALGQMFAKIGLDVKVNAQPRTVFFPARTRGDYILTMAGWGTVTGEAGYSLSSFVHSNDKSKGLGAFNVSNFKNDDVDRSIFTAMRVMDDARRRALFEKAMETALREKGQIPIVSLSNVWAARAGMVEFKPRIDDETLPYFIKPVKK
jgi:peptide/nickel transport system substrate-binding protein